MKLEQRNYWKSLINMSLCRFFTLRALYNEPVHGYAILEKLKEFTHGFCTPAYGTIYPILKELMKGKYVKVKSETVRGRVRKVYELTEKGKSAYGASLKAWREVIPCIEKAIKEGNKKLTVE